MKILRLASLALLASVLAAPPALAQGRPQARGAALLGFEDGSGPAGLALRVDGELVQRPLGPGVGFSLVGSLGYSHFSDHGGTWDPFYGYDASWEQSLGIFKVIPAARFTFGHNPRVRPYADAGLGFYWASWSYEATTAVPTAFPPYYAIVGEQLSDSEVGVVLRFAGGVAFDVSPGFSLGAEAGIMPYLGDFADDSTFTLMLAAQFRL